MIRIKCLVPIVTAFALAYAVSITHAQVTVVQRGQVQVKVTADLRDATPTGSATLLEHANWLATSLHKATGDEVAVTQEPADGPAIIIGLARNRAKIAAGIGLERQSYDDYAIVTPSTNDRIYILGNSEAAVGHGVADLLRRWGFRWFAPSENWRITPRLEDVHVHINAIGSPHLVERRIWYAYGMSGNDLRPLMADYKRWAVANRLTLQGLVRTGHSYGSIVGRNKEAFATNPALSAMRPDGTRDTTSVLNARKFCVSNPALIDLVTSDRRKLLATNRKSIPSSFMVSVDPSDGEGTCHCADCKKLGTTTDRVFHLANEVAIRLRQDDPRAWVGLYAYSSHRLPPTIDVEPNVYVQVALGFNRTQYSLPELVERWSKKVQAIGLREYYGVEAWDWGLPGRARGGRVGYHRQWIPFYAERNLNGINAETNANWGAQALGLYVASQMMWNPSVDVDSLEDEFFNGLFADAAKPMRAFYQKMEAAPPLRPATLLPMFDDLESAWSMTRDTDVRKRLVDLMAYMVYVMKFREFDIARSQSADHGDAYYAAVKSLMNYAWRIRHRDMVHYYALARRLCNALPLQDNRPEFSLRYEEGDPVWMNGDAPSDDQISTLFRSAKQQLHDDGDPTVHFSRYFDPVKVPGDDGGPSYIHATPRQDVAVSRFRRGLLGYLIPSGALSAKLGIAPTSKPVKLTVYMRKDVIFEQTYRQTEGFHDVEIPLPRAFEYHVHITGDFELRVPASTPFIFEASVTRPAWVSYSGPHYFYIPKGTRELIFDANPRLTLEIPGHGRKDFVPANRVKDKSHIVVPVPEGTDGSMWHTATLTRGQISLLNIPPLFSFHRNTVFVPRELSESEGLSTKR